MSYFPGKYVLDWNHGFDNYLYLLMMKHLGSLWKEICLSAVWRETEVPELQCLGRNLGILRTCLRASVTPDCLPLLPRGKWQLGETREQTAGKYLTSASDVEKKDGEMTDHSGWKEPNRVPTSWCNYGITQLTLWQSQKDSIPLACGWQFVVWCGEAFKGGTWAILKKKYNNKYPY